MNFVPRLSVRRKQEPALRNAMLLMNSALCDASSTMKPLPSVRFCSSEFSNEIVPSTTLVPVASNSVTPLDQACSVLVPLCAAIEFFRWKLGALKNVNPVRPFEYEIQCSISQYPFDTLSDSTPSAQPLPKPMLKPRATIPWKRTYCAVEEPTPLSCTSSAGPTPGPSRIGVAQSSALKVIQAASVPPVPVIQSPVL